MRGLNLSLRLSSDTLLSVENNALQKVDPFRSSRGITVFSASYCVIEEGFSSSNGFEVIRTAFEMRIVLSLINGKRVAQRFSLLSSPNTISLVGTNKISSNISRVIGSLSRLPRFS